MTIIGSASIQIRADDKYFEPDVRRAVGRIKNVAIKLKADVDITAASKKIRDLRYRITNKDAVLGVDADTKKAEAKLIRFMENYLENEVVFRATTDLRNVESEIEGVKDIAREDALFEIEADIASAERAMATVKAMVEDFKAEIKADADTAGAETQLNFTARNRTSVISAKFDPAIAAGLTGAFNTLTGTLPFETVKNQIAGVAANFESMSVGAAKAATVIGSVGAALLTTSANAVSVADDILEVINLLGFMPIGIIALTTVLKANKFAWEGFGTAATDNSDKANLALEKLPPAAQTAALALRGLRAELQENSQRTFWEAMGESLQNMMDSVFPSVNTGMASIASSLGRLQAAAFDATAQFGELGKEGDGVTVIKTILDNVATGVDNLTRGIDDAINGFTAFAEVGSTYLPRFGDYLSDLAEDFGAFATKAKDNGDMERWMDTGIQRAQELGTVIASTSRIFNGLAEASKLSGAPGLTELAAGFERVADVVNGEPFQSRLITVLEGARRGTDELARGFGNLVGFISESSESIGLFLAQAGKIGGIGFDSIKALFDGTGLGSGLMEALYGFEDALKALEPGFANLGAAIGDLGEIAAELFVNMAPGLNLLFDTIRQVIAGFKDGVIDAMPVLNEFIQSILMVVSDAVIPMAAAFGNMLSIFSELPGPIQTILMALGGLLLLKAKFGGFFDQFKGDLKDTDTRLGQSYKNMRDGADRTRVSVRDSFSLMGVGMQSTMEKTGAGVQKSFGDAGRFMHSTFADSMARTQATIVGGMGAAMSQSVAAVQSGTSSMSGFMRTMGAGFREAIISDSELGRVSEGFARTGQSIRDSMARTQATIVGGMGAAMSQAGDSINGLANRIAPVDGRIRALGTSIADVGRNIATGFGDAGRTIGTGITTGVATANTAIRTMGTGISAAAGQIGSNLAPARAAFSDLARHITTSMAGAGKKMGIGLMDVLGGGWGVALAGATVALAAYAKASAESKARVEELSKAVDVQSGSFEEAGAKMLGTNLMDGATTKWDDFFRGVFRGAKSTEEIVGQLGTSFEDIGKKLADNSGRDAYVKGWNDISTALGNFKPVTQEMADAVGIPLEKLKEMNTFDASYMTGEINKIAEEADRAAVRAAQLGDAFDTTDVAGAQMARNFDVLGDAATSVSDKVAALKSNLDLQSGGLQSASKNATDFASAMFATEDSVRNIASSTEGAIDANGRLADSFRSTLTDATGGFTNATRESIAFKQSMESAADAVLTSGIAEMNRLRDSGVNLADAQAAALVTMDASTQTLRASLTNMGFDAGQVQTIIDSLKLNPDQLKAALVVETGDAESKMFRMELLRAALVDGNWELALTALTDEAKASIEGAGAIGEAYAAGDYTAVINALNKAGVPVAEFMLQMSEARNDAEREMILKATFGSDAVVSETKDKLYGIGKGLTPAELTADWTSGAVVARATGDIRGYGELREQAELLLKDNGIPVLATAKSNVTTWGTTKANAELGATDRFSDIFFQGKSKADQWSMPLRPLDLLAQDLATPVVDGAVASVQKYSGPLARPAPVDLMALDLTGPAVTSATTGVGGFMGMSRGGAPIELPLSARDETGAGVGGAKASIGTFQSITDAFVGLFARDETAAGVGSASASTQSLTDVTRGLFANNNTGGGVAGAQGTMGSLADVWRGLFANNNTGAATGGAQATMSSLQDVYRSLVAQNATGTPTAEANATMSTLQNVMRQLQAQNATGAPTAGAQGTMNTLQNVMRQLQAQNMTGGPKANAQGTMNSLQNVMRDLNARNMAGGPKANAQGTMNSLQGVTRDLNARNMTGGAKAGAQGTISSLQGKTVDLNARDNTGGPVSTARASIASVVGKTVDIISNFIRRGDNADGGVWMGGQRAFADGGILGGTQQQINNQVVKSFAKGGIENHTAQIARGAWPVRVWAEPETGGEAYIPLSPSKRKRSLQILKVVMSQFGLSEFAQFAQGGVMKGTNYASTPSVVSDRYSTSVSQSRQTVNVGGGGLGAPIIQVYPSQGLSEEQIGESAAREFFWQTMNK